MGSTFKILRANFFNNSNFNWAVSEFINSNNLKERTLFSELYIEIIF